MNPRDMDALLDSWKSLGLRDFIQDDDVRYTAEHAWIRDIFKSKLTCWTDERDRYPGFAPRRAVKSVRNEELQAGDTTELDSFLAGFSAK